MDVLVEFNINICLPIQSPDRVAGCTSIDILCGIVNLVRSTDLVPSVRTLDICTSTSQLASTAIPAKNGSWLVANRRHHKWNQDIG